MILDEDRKQQTDYMNSVTEEVSSIYKNLSFHNSDINQNDFIKYCNPILLRKINEVMNIRLECGYEEFKYRDDVKYRIREVYNSVGTEINNMTSKYRDFIAEKKQLCEKIKNLIENNNSNELNQILEKIEEFDDINEWKPFYESIVNNNNFSVDSFDQNKKR